jgi:predicted ATPase
MGMLAPVPGMRGREAETAVLDDAIDRATAGRLAVVLIDGEAGIGKTRLLDAALDAARGRGLQVAAGRAAELEQARPFGLVAAMFGCTRSARDPRRAAIGELLATAEGGARSP